MVLLSKNRAKLLGKIDFCPYLGKKGPKAWYFVFLQKFCHSIFLKMIIWNENSCNFWLSIANLASCKILNLELLPKIILVGLWRRGVVVITTAQLHLSKPEFMFCASSNPARGASEIRNGEDLWQWSLLEIRLNAFRRSTIPQKQFIIIIRLQDSWKSRMSWCIKWIFCMLINIHSNKLIQKYLLNVVLHS